jgi:hypothetical protein
MEVLGIYINTIICAGFGLGRPMTASLIQAYEKQAHIKIYDCLRRK